MNLSDWIITATIVITIVPLIKMAKEKRFGFYNISIVIIGITIIALSILKNRKDESLFSKKERDSFISDSSNKAEINKLVLASEKSEKLLTQINTSLDSFGLKTNEQGNVSVGNIQKFKAATIKINSQTNVSSYNQEGGQTARDITNN